MILVGTGSYGGSMTNVAAQAQKLLALHTDPKLLTVVNVWDAISAKIWMTPEESAITVPARGPLVDQVLGGSLDA